MNIHNKCLGCGLCAVSSEFKIQMKWNNGYLYPQSDNSDIIKICSLDCKPEYHKPVDSFIAHHKILERRMDGSAGGVYGAILESIVKQHAFFTGTIYGDDLKVHHVLTDDPEMIKSFSGYKPTQSDPYLLFPKIKELLEGGNTVLFGGLPCQCHSLRVYLEKKYDNLYIVDTVCDGIKSQEIVELYSEEIKTKENAEVTGIRYYNKEFPCKDSKRISLSNGRMLYTEDSEPFDYLLRSGLYTRKDCVDCSFSSLEERVGDISIGAYNESPIRWDDFGYSYISINTEKGANLFEKIKKRIEIKDYNSFNKEYVRYSKPITTNKTLDNCETTHQIFEDLYPVSSKQKIRKKVGRVLSVLKMLKDVSRLHPKPVCQFIRYNFFCSNVKRCGGFMYIAPHCEFLLDRNITIELHGPLVIGLRRIPTSKLETRLRMSEGSKIIVHKHALIGNGSNVEIYRDALLEIGSLNNNSPIVIICGNHIKMGDSVNIARGCTIRDTNGHLVVMPGYKIFRPLEIGNHTWICSDSTIMPGVKIGDGAIVGACSFVSQSVSDHTLVQGEPAKEIGKPEYFVM